MTVQPIRPYGDPVLRTPAAPMADFDADLFDTTCAAPGLGLAAPQIGVGLRVFVYRTEDDGYGHLVNPRLSFPSEEEQDGRESCLSTL